MTFQQRYSNVMKNVCNDIPATNLVVFKLDLKKYFWLLNWARILRLEPGQQDPVTDCMIQNAWNDQVFKLFIDAYKKSYSYETLWGGSLDHVEFGRI